MKSAPLAVKRSDKAVLQAEDLDMLIQNLRKRGHQVIGPTRREGAIVYEELASAQNLPAGWTDEQDGGTYRLKRRTDGALFGYAVGPHSWKEFVHPPAQRLYRARRNGKQVEFLPETPPAAKCAFLGVRACELNAIAIQDRVFLGGPVVDPGYQSRRQQLFLIAVNCTVAGGTCFCASMNTGPKAASGYDVALTEVMESGRHYFMTEAGTDRGAEVLSQLPLQRATSRQEQIAADMVSQTARRMARQMDTTGIEELFYRNYEHPRWDDVAKRCLTCANCTLVCPTCFCTTVEDTADLTGQHAERWRKWDSCFTLDFSYIAGGSVRSSSRARYRQWLTHKLATWMDQFGTSGCVGCGRCITWCPAAIDLTEEVRALREGGPARGAAPTGKETKP
ncbi:MAG: 4Fe-4S dicluster domain-containing protein [Verrucomicrobiota bacterium]|nr:4Fe-4S dicluster domain-containing protein [Verrucomicrobiota bacterium]